jgi:hypothetical protein
MERKVVQRGLEDETFRRRLIEDPRVPSRKSSEPGCPKSYRW